MTIQSEMAIIQQKLDEAIAYMDVRTTINIVFNSIVELENKVVQYQSGGLFNSIPI